MTYEKFIPLAGQKNKPNQTQFKAKTNPISKRPKMNVKFCKIMAYENKSNRTLGENKPKQTQFKPNQSLS
jgi:hypothetical protein